jgi:hypothetical protein
MWCTWIVTSEQSNASLTTRPCKQLVHSRKKYRVTAHLEFPAEDFTQLLPVCQASFELLLSLYAPEVTRYCITYVKPAGLVVSNNHHGDAEFARSDPRLEFVGVVHERRGSFNLQQTDLDVAAAISPQPKSAGRLLRRALGPELSRPHFQLGLVRHPDASDLPFVSPFRPPVGGCIHQCLAQALDLDIQ